MTRPTLDVVVELERRVWDALVRGDAQADGALLADDFVGVYPTGFATKADHIDQLAGGPTVARYEIQDPRLVDVADDAVLLAYRARYWRPGATDAETMYVSSLWCYRDERWVNTFSQDTPRGGPVP